MSRRLLPPALALGLAFTGSAFAGAIHLAAREPTNLSLLKQEIETYVDSGEYEHEIARVAAEAEAWLEQRVAKGRGKSADPAQGRLAAVFDIDETLLSNLPEIRRMGFGYVPNQWDAWVGEGRAPALAPVCELLRTARRLGVAVFILTGRRDADRPATEKNLHAVGVGDHTALLFKPDSFVGSTEAFKTAQRKKITADGYTIILNIGDQESDLAGGFAEKTFKLPDPFYLMR